jgi:serine/threonine protein kinase
LTPSYASLEQWNGDPPDPRDDVYAFGILIYELLSGYHPFAGVSSKKAFESGLSPQRLDKLGRVQWDGLRHALALRREQRTKTIKELLLALEPQAFLRKHRAFIVTGGAIATVAALGFGINVIVDSVEGSTICPAPLPHAPVALTPEKVKEINDNLFLAQDYLKDAKLSANPADLAYVLSEGANNVNQILEDGVLKADPDNEQARKIKAQITDLYLGKARELFDQRAYTAALDLVQYGRKVSPCNRDLYHLQKDLRSRTDARTDAVR